MSDGFEVVCGELRKAAGRLRDDGGDLGLVAGEIKELGIPAQSFGQVPPMDLIADLYGRLRVKVGEALATGAAHLQDAGDGLRDVARHYVDQDAENAKPFQR